ncbi:MAG: sigma-70 family RNA polymerase sigma factor [Kyrpidia sp.]|uniref:RNA polymerase, sigma-24 subunit, ECF subfamily n=3 Tax=Kyrpidia TaxID=1129704 RepID=A0ACA8Z640_9BACL|nr:RNA polymerase, sigma-24 subunit, ECF subfamily [Kyrpidia tusciae DSM 2912]MCL6577571.1 sigma-70 family RNA polymerase sigma factor [Kyrpidia sp.]CAB3389993.1 RNA polymerase, sigma-24 subunit, ECF subfamily [Kyrpidia spormannii]CAB3390912.1 RNA polymerase, sigma-24 subunit, ECF subfamily [Kyrpidia spormannii]
MKKLAAKYWLPNDTEDEVIQVLRIELWNAVKEYRPGRPFQGFAKMFLHNRLKTLVARKVYGGKHVFFREAVSLETAVSDRTAQRSVPSAEDEAMARLIRLALKERLYEVLDQALTDLERECFVRRYIFEQSYKQIQKELGDQQPGSS